MNYFIFFILVLFYSATYGSDKAARLALKIILLAVAIHIAVK